jgi:beta-glucanase (GH16 family)
MKLLRFFSFGVFLIFSCQINSQSNDYHLVWQDTFDGNELNLNNWVIEVNGSGNGNNELEYYRKENVSIGTEPVSGEKCLVLTAKKENYLGKTCTSGRINSLGKISFKHGKIEARIKLPHTANGLWPVFG